MKHIFLNLKRFDVLADDGGVNRLGALEDWASTIISSIEKNIVSYDAEFAAFFPEAHILNAAKSSKGIMKIGCQGVYRNDVEKGKNFGAFTTNRPAIAARELGSEYVLIGHCEERMDLEGIIDISGGDKSVVNTILNSEIKNAINRGMKVLYCIGEKDGESLEDTIKKQIDEGLKGIDHSMITLAYEPVWAIGPGKTPPDRAYIEKVAKFVKSKVEDIDLVYGGGLKKDNAAMLASIPEIDGGLIALTRFSENFGFYPDEYLEIVKLYMEA